MTDQQTERTAELIAGLRAEPERDFAEDFYRALALKSHGVKTGDFSEIDAGQKWLDRLVKEYREWKGK